MARYRNIASVTFDGVALPHVLAARVCRGGQTHGAWADDGRFAESVQLSGASLAVEVRTRDTDAAESLSPGQAGVLEAEALPASGADAVRRLRIDQAVLHSIDLEYRQGAPAEAVLRFLAESADGSADPFDAEEALS